MLAEGASFARSPPGPNAHQRPGSRARQCARATFRNSFEIEGGTPKFLSRDGSWREPPASIGEQLERERLEKDRLEYLAGSQERQLRKLQDELGRLRDWTGSDADGEGNVGLSSLIRIVGDSAASPRQRIKASAAILGYQVHDDGVTAFVKRFLGSLCESADISVDHKVEAAELLRRHEAPRVGSETVRPTYREDGSGSETARIEAWRSYLYKQRKWKLVMDSRATLESVAPDRLPAGWCDDLNSDDFVPPESGGPPWS